MNPEDTKLKTLIVDDEEIVTSLAEGIAKGVMGEDTDVVHSAEDAKAKWLEGKHEMIILDLNLPGMSGQEFCRWLREHNKGKDVFVLVCTGDSKPETFRNVLHLGANDYITKPLHPGLLSVRMEIAKNTIYQTLKKQALQEELTRNEKRFRLISENSRDLVCTHTPDGVLTYVSPSSKNLLGIENTDLIGKTLDEVKINDTAQPVNLSAIADELNGQLESTQVWEAQHRSGKTVWLETFSQASRNEGEQIVEIYSYSRDVTEAKNEEAQLRIINAVGEETDTAGLLNTIVEEMEDCFQATVMIHIHGKPGEYETYRLPAKKNTAEVEGFHKDLDIHTSKEKAVFQSSNAASVYHSIANCENMELEAVITHPIRNNYGRPIGKITIASKSILPESERTKAVLLLCSTRIGSILQEHLIR